MDEPSGDRNAGAEPMNAVKRLAVAFGRFWWDFLIGDTPELFVGAVAVVGIVALLCIDPALRTACAVILPALVLTLLGLSVRRASRASSS